MRRKREKGRSATLRAFPRWGGKREGDVYGRETVERQPKGPLQEGVGTGPHLEG